MKTAVQFFWDKIALKLSVEQVNDFLPILEQAKEIGKDHILEAYHNGHYYHGNWEDEFEYYNETYGNKQ